MKELTVDIDLNEEVKAIVDFISDRWSPIKDLEKIVLQVRDQALNDTRAWFNSDKFSLHIQKMKRARGEFLEQDLEDPDEKQMCSMFDNIIAAMDMINRSSMVMHRAALTLDFDVEDKGFDDYVKPLQNRIAKQHKGLDHSKPHGWKEVKENYPESCDQNYDRVKDHLSAYKGVDPKGVTWHLAEKLSVYNLVEDYERQGRSPVYWLIASVYSHFQTINQFLNTEKMLQAIESTLPFDYKGVAFDLPSLGNSGSKLFEVLLKGLSDLPTRESFEKSVSSRKAPDTRSDSEKIADKKESARIISDMLSSMWSSSPEEEKLRMEKDRRELIKMKRRLRSDIPVGVITGKKNYCDNRFEP